MISSKSSSPGFGNIGAFSSLMVKAKEYEELKARYISISSRKISKQNSLEVSSQTPWLKAVTSQLKICENEYTKLITRLSQPQVPEAQLEQQVKNLKSKVALLEKENLRLNASQKYLPKIQILSPSKTDLEESYRSIKGLKEAIAELEAKKAENFKHSRTLTEKFNELMSKLKRLNNELGDYIPVQPDSRYEHLKRKLEALSASWKANVNKYEIRITELEEEMAALKEKLMQLNAQSFKRSQQMRLLKMSHQEVLMLQESGKLLSRPDIDHPDVGFMYKPSVKALYNI